MRLLIRSWNVFHGNAYPPRRKGYLRRMIELVFDDEPDVVCLQEVPVWALRRLETWSGMTSFGAVARPPLVLGPLSTWVTRLHQGLFRSGLAGQANVILVASRHEPIDLGLRQISEDGRERRVVHAVRLEGARILVANLHASNEFVDPSVPRGEALRARAFVEELAIPGEAIVLAGDFNVVDPQLSGFSRPGNGIDDILVHGAPAGVADVWPLERRTVDGVVLSDHPPIECVIEVPSP